MERQSILYIGLLPYTGSEYRVSMAAQYPPFDAMSFSTTDLQGNDTWNQNRSLVPSSLVIDSRPESCFSRASRRECSSSSHRERSFASSLISARSCSYLARALDRSQKRKGAAKTIIPVKTVAKPSIPLPFIQAGDNTLQEGVYPSIAVYQLRLNYPKLGRAAAPIAH